MEYLIREFNHIDDVAALTQVWLVSLPDDFLSCLGANFIGEAYIPELLSSHPSFCYVATKDDSLIGFVLAANSEGLLRRVVTRNLYKFLKAWLSAFTDAPFSMLFRTISVAIYLMRSLKLSHSTEEIIELCYIATHQHCRGQGVGKALVRRLYSEVSVAANVKALSVKTLHGTGNGRAGRFYQENGFEFYQRVGDRAVYLKAVEPQRVNNEIFQ
ncbi:GNAT family N-acetyltransferase [Rhodobacterales bacterium LSUCC0387]|nr:GNAT family N-acetyltransferase [Rhodobacterales bacterium LSUCC0387]